MKTTKTPDHNPTGRTRPKRKMGTVLRAKLSKYRARVSEFEDDAPSSTVVRWLVVLLLLHLLVIGGVYVRSTWFRNTAETVEMAAALPAPPTVPQRPAPAAPPAALPQVPQAPPRSPGHHHAAGTGSGRSPQQAAGPCGGGTHSGCSPGGRSCAPHRAHGRYLGTRRA